MFTYSNIFANKHNILFVTAHPDDVIVFYGGLISKLVSDKKQVYVVTVTNGCRGSGNKAISEEELGNLRINEELAALTSLGVPSENHVCLDYKDGEVESNYQLIGEVSKYIRKFRADIICTHEPTVIYTATYDKNGYFVQHRDHRKVAEAVVDAAYPFSRDKAFFPEHLQDGVAPHTVMELIMTDENGSNFQLEYTNAVESKIKALELHQSQFPTRKDVQDLVDEVKDVDRYIERYSYIKLIW